jgi:hypothetical protein
MTSHKGNFLQPMLYVQKNRLMCLWKTPEPSHTSNSCSDTCSQTGSCDSGSNIGSRLMIDRPVVLRGATVGWGASRDWVDAEGCPHREALQSSFQGAEVPHVPRESA